MAKMCAVLGGCGDRPTGTLWVVAIVFSIPIGVYSGWGTSLSGPFLAILTDLTGLCVGIRRRAVLPSPVRA